MGLKIEINQDEVFMQQRALSSSFPEVSVRSKWHGKECAAIEALRLGVVNRHVVQFTTYGRDEELATITKSISNSPRGSAKVIVGRYGVGKSHLCEAVTDHLLSEGYVVARLELGSSSERAENPDALLSSILRSIKLKWLHQGIEGATELHCALDALEPPRDKWHLHYKFLQQLYEDNPGSEMFSLRLSKIIIHYMNYHESADLSRQLLGTIPTAMSASNLAVAKINELAHKLSSAGFKGLVVMLDEAERACWSLNAYRLNRARDTILGLGLAAANKSTSCLKHYGNDTRSSYRPLNPSRFHCIFWFSSMHGLAAELARSLQCKITHLEALSPVALQVVTQKVMELHFRAYQWNSHDIGERLAIIKGQGTDVRSVVRQVVGLLDSVRFP